MVKQSISVKQYSEKETFNKAEKRLVSLFEEIPFLKVTGSKSNIRINDKEIDILFDTRVSGKPAKIIVEIKSQGEPRLVRMAVSQLKSYLQEYKDAYGILVAPYLSDAGRQICKEEGVGCADLAGNAFISFRNIFIDRSGLPNPFTVKRIAKSVFSPKSSRVLRVLLASPSKKWYVEDMSAEAGISIGLVSKVKQALLAEEWIKEEDRKFYLVKPEEALARWTDNYSYTKNGIYSFYSSLPEDQLEKAIGRECNKRNLRYGLALFSGARKVAPFVRFLRFFAYVDGSVDEIADALQFKKVESGANVSLMRPYDEGLFYAMQNIDGVNVVSDIQLYLDLKSYKGRGEEAAQAVFERRIKAAW